MSWLTEDEAKKKWCPFARAMGHNNDHPTITTINRFDDGALDHRCHCVASACMAWRQAHRRRDGAIFDSRPMGSLSDAVGHCGLAGRVPL